MIQLSSSPAEFIPASQGTEKNTAPTIKNDGFRTALREQQDQVRASSEARSNEGAERDRSADVAQSAEAPREEGIGEKPVRENRADENRRGSTAEKSSKSGKSEAKTAKSASTDEESVKTAWKGKKDSSGSSLLHLVKSDKGDEKISVKKDALLAGKIGGKKLSPGEVSEVQASQLAAATGAAVSEESAVKPDKSGPEPALTMKGSAGETGSPDGPGSTSASADGSIPASTGEEAAGTRESLTAAADSLVSKDSLKTAKSDEKKKSHDVKISVEDRRTAKEPAPLLRRVEENSEGNKLTMELTPSSEDVATPVGSADNADTSGKNFVLMNAEEQKGAALLDRQLQDGGTRELAKNIRFVLKDNKEGEIKLILKPEALGKVRINLNLNENNIVGKIIVENSNVRQVFMNNLADLTRSLEESGFNTASLDVSVGGGQAEGGSQYRQENPVYFASSSELDELDGQIPVVYEEGMNLGRIDLVV